MEIYNDKLCLTADEIWSVLGSNFNTLLSRGRVKNLLGRACYNRPALYDVDEFPNNKKNRYRDELYNAYPELTDWKKLQEEREYKNAILRNIVPDPGAEKFFAEYKKPSGQPLTDVERIQYANSAKILNAIRRVWERMYSRHSAAGTVSKMRLGEFFQKMSGIMPEVVKEYKPSFNCFSWRRLQQLYADYGNNNYGALLSGSIGNQNKTKKQRKLIVQIVLSIYCSKDKPFVSDITTYYNEFVLGTREIYNENSGEVYNRADFIHNGEPITISDGLVWNIINDPLNRKVVDRLRNDFHYNQNRHNADVQRESPYFSLSKVSFDDRDLVRKAVITRRNKVTGREERYEATVHAYYAFDVASGVCVGSAYSLKKDVKLVEDCMRNMWANLRSLNLCQPYEFEVENHLIKGTELENRFRNSCMELTFCAPMNSRQKRSEHDIKDKKWYGFQSEVKRGMAHGRHYAKHEAYLHSREKVFDEMNDTYKNSLPAMEFDRVVAEDRAQMAAWHNEPHPRLKDKKTGEKRYPGMTRMAVLMMKQNKQCAPLNWRILCKDWGISRSTSVERGRSVTIDYREWWLSSAEVITRFAPNNTGCTAYWIPNLAGDIDEVYLYQGERYIDKPKIMGKFQEAVAERTDKDIAIMNAQLGWISHAKKVAKDRKGEVILGKIGMVKSEQVTRAFENIQYPQKYFEPPEPEPEKPHREADAYDYTEMNEDDIMAYAINSI